VGIEVSEEKALWRSGKILPDRVFGTSFWAEDTLYQW
jgi:hypothetical protein